MNPDSDASVPAPPSPARWAVDVGVIAATVVCTATLFAGLFGFLAPVPLALLTVVFGAVAVGIVRSTRGVSIAPEVRIPWPLRLSLVLLGVQTAATWPLPPDDWDAMTYHLFLPYRWLQEGGFVHVPTVFSDNSSAFAPQNGAVFFAWSTALTGNDFVINVVQVGALLLLAASVGLLLQRFGVGVAASVMAVAALPWIAPFQKWTFSANVDLFLVAFWTAAVALLLGDGSRRELLLGGLALGLALGTKTVGLPLAVGLTTIAAPRLLKTRKNVLFFAAGTFATGAFWWLRNAWLYGNPLFPLDLSLGAQRILPGVYNSATLRSSSIFHIEDFGEWLGQIHALWGVSTCIFFVVGILALATAFPKRVGVETALLACGWTWFAYAVVPHNNQDRFLLPAFALAVVGWGLLYERFPSKTRTAVFVFVLSALAAASRPDQFVLERLAKFAAPTDLRTATFAEADYALWRPGFLPFQSSESAPQIIAYSGGNVPYVLTGPDGRHRVTYCNVQGDPDDGLWEFWNRSGRRLYPTYRPGIYRGAEDVDAWLACLQEREVDTVVLFWVIPVGVPDDWALEDGFPIERRWMRERPERFRRIAFSDRAEIWTVR